MVSTSHLLSSKSGADDTSFHYSAPKLWHTIGCPYEEAVALAAGDRAGRDAALAIFERLGARPWSDDPERVVHHRVVYPIGDSVRRTAAGDRHVRELHPHVEIRIGLRVVDARRAGGLRVCGSIMVQMVCTSLAPRLSRRHRCLASVVGFWLAALCVVGGGTARADETLEFDAAGSAPRISLIGDSTLAGVRWYFDYGALQRFNFVLNAESCRRTVEPSCFSREGYRSANVIAVMQSLDGQLGEVVVIMSGYNDPISSIDEAIDGVIDEARRQGVGNVVWLTLRAGGDVSYQDPQEQTSARTFEEYNEQLLRAAEKSDGFLQVADWATYSNGAAAWFESDGVHLTSAGVDAVTTFIAGSVERVLAGESINPTTAAWTTLVPGAEGEVVSAVQQAVVDAGVALPGGVDGVFGNETMFAVAEYQRLVGDLQVTGAVDMATARALGVFEDDDAAVTDAPSSPEQFSALQPAAPEAPSESIQASDVAGAASGIQLFLALGALAVGALVLAVAIAVIRGRRGFARPARSHAGARH
ncbi:MAG: GDSL-type esterase/lipase family protein [Actinomycetota bacterium]